VFGDVIHDKMSSAIQAWAHRVDDRAVGLM